MNKEFQRMQQLAGLLTEVKISALNFPRFTADTIAIDKDMPDWDQTPDDVGYEEYIYYHSPKSSTTLQGYPHFDDYYVEPKTPNSIIFGAEIDTEQEEILQDLISYLRSHNVQYNINRYAENNDYAELYLSVSLDELKRKKLIKI